MASKHIYTFFCLVCLLVSGLELRAQAPLDSIPITGDWESAGYVQDSPDMRVEIEYRLQKNNCDATGFMNQQFRFKIEALKKPLGFERYLSFKIMFEDCSGVIICKTVNLNIGIRQKNDVWDGIQPLRDPNSDNSFTGRRLIKAFYDVKLVWEKDPTKDSECKIVDDTNKPTPPPKPPVGGNRGGNSPQGTLPTMIYEMAKSIGLKSKKLNCVGEEVAFYPIGGKIDNLIKYHWTKNSCDGEQVWVGDTLLVKPLESTTYFLKLVGLKAPSKCISINYVVNSVPVNNLDFTKNVLPNNGGVIINIARTDKIKDIPVSWYWDSIDPAHRISSSEFLLIDKEFKPGKKYFYRFENACGASNAKLVTFDDANWSSEPLPVSNSNVSSETSAIIGSETPTENPTEVNSTPALPPNKALVTPTEEESDKKAGIYLGGGILSGGNSAIQPFYLMAGIGQADIWKIYVRYKKASSGTLGAVSSTLEANNTKITNFPVNTNTYYVISDKVASQRQSITGGLMFKINSLFDGYIGAGVGNNQVYWNAETYSYANPGLRVINTWVKNKAQSANGLEGEVGGTVKIKNFNIQGGINMIKGDSGMFISADFGLGITF